MKLTLMIEGSAATIAAVLADLDKRNDGTTIDVQSFAPEPSAAPQMAPHPMTAPGGTMPMPANTADDDDDGDDATPSTADVDSTGMPWDERIHSGGKAMTNKGVWKKRKGVDTALVAQVEAERRGAPAIPQMTPVTQMPAAMPMQQPEPTPTPVAMPMGGGMPGMPAAPTFPEFMVTLSSQMQTGKITTDQTVWVAGQLGVNALTDLGTKPELIGKAIELFRNAGLWVG